MKRWMKILCVLTVLVCVVWGAVSYFHYNTVRTLLNRRNWRTTRTAGNCGTAAILWGLATRITTKFC